MCSSGKYSGNYHRGVGEGAGATWFSLRRKYLFSWLQTLFRWLLFRGTSDVSEPEMIILELIIVQLGWVGGGGVFWFRLKEWRHFQEFNVRTHCNNISFAFHFSLAHLLREYGIINWDIFLCFSFSLLPLSALSSAISCYVFFFFSTLAKRILWCEFKRSAITFL